VVITVITVSEGGGVWLDSTAMLELVGGRLAVIVAVVSRTVIAGFTVVVVIATVGAITSLISGFGTKTVHPVNPIKNRISTRREREYIVELMRGESNDLN